MAKQTVATLETEFTANTRDVDRGFAHVERRAQESARKISSTLSTVGSSGAFKIGGAAGLGGALGGAAGNLLKSGVGVLFGQVREMVERGMQFADVMQQSNIAFTNLLGSEAKSVEHLKEMVAFGAKTPFQTRDLFQYSQQLQAVGINAQDVRKSLEAIGDAASKAGNFDRMDKAVLAITQMLGKGKVTAEELRGQLSEAIPGAIQYMASSQGITTAELEKRLQAGTLNAPAAVELMLLQMKKEAGGAMMEVATKTVAGVRSTLEDTKDIAAARAVLGGDITGGAQAGSVYATERTRLLNRTNTIGSFAGGPFEKTVSGAGGKVLAAEAYIEDELMKPAAGSEAVKNFFGGLFDGSVAKQAQDAAKNIAGTISDTLVNGIGAATTAGEGLGSGILAGINATWDFGSPSRRAIQLGLWIKEGLEIGLSRGQARNYAALKELTTKEPDFLRTLGIEAGKRNVNPDDMLNLMAIESGFNKSVVNKFGYGGLGQVGRSERKELGLPQNDAAFKKLLEESSASWQLEHVLFPFLDMKIKENKGAARGGLTMSELYAMWGSGHATGNPESVHAAAGGKRAGMYANNPLWDFNKDRRIQEWEFGAAAPNALGAGVKFSVNGLANVTTANPMPVAIVGAGAGAGVAVGGFTPPAGAVRLDKKPVYENGRLVGYDSVDPSAGGGGTGGGLRELPMANRSFNDLLKSLPTVRGVSVSTAAAPAPGGVQGLTAEEEARRQVLLKTVNESKLKISETSALFHGMATGFQESFAGAFSSFEGGVKGVFSRMAVSWAQSVAEMVIQAQAAKLTQALFGSFDEQGKSSGGGFLSKLFGIGVSAIAGGIGGGGGLSSTPGSSNSVYSGMAAFGGRRAGGGTVNPGYFYEVNEQGREFIAPTAPMQVLNKTQVGGATSTTTIINNNSIYVPVRNSGGYSQPRARRDIAEAIAASLR